MPLAMKVDLFDFSLPEALIATHPASPRDSARLLDVPPEGPFHDRLIRDLPHLLHAGDALVVNDTRVIPTRLFGRRGEARIEATLHKNAGNGAWWAFAKPGKRLRPGDTVLFEDILAARVVSKDDHAGVLLDFGMPEGELLAALEDYGAMPLPPYIARKEGPQESDRSDYQTMFADRPGAVAAPTAGLHFTPELHDRIASLGVKTLRLTLHVGAGTFLPVKVEDTNDHRMHSEYGELSQTTADALNKVRRDGGRLIPVGTTALRLLETATGDDRVIRPFCGDTNIFLTPGCRFNGADALMTNFHLPRSTLFMLVCAFAGTERMKAAYAHAIEQCYRFYSYGDACFLRHTP